MTPEERGRRIKEARIAKKMTQSEVVGSFITRNMLSQIESGSAVPSLKTLEYLASVLDIPISTLMPQNESDCVFPETEALISAKKHFAEGNYRAAVMTLDSIDDNSSLSDEFSAVKARCYLKLAEETADSDAAKAVEYAKEAAVLAERGFYANSALKAEASALLNNLAEQLKKYYEDIISGL
ncbi:MAG: helix-turn-helix domain-containing protein [Oscillospiraceae bacterium]